MYVQVLVIYTLLSYLIEAIKKTREEVSACLHDEATRVFTNGCSREDATELLETIKRVEEELGLVEEGEFRVTKDALNAIATKK